MSDDIEISGHAGFTMGPVARWVCVNSDGFTVAYVDTIERAQGFIETAASAEREAVLVEALTELHARASKFYTATNAVNGVKNRALVASFLNAKEALATVSDTAEKD